MNDPHHGPQPTDLAGWALKYAATGIAVFPVNPETKAPIGATEGPDGATIWMATKGHTSATTDPDTITAWWRLRPDALIGARIPQHLIVLDIDPRHDGLTTWAAIIDGHDLPVTRRHASGRNDGGFHIWFQNPNLARIDAGHGIDVLTWAHRYTILPPSPHPATGRPYRWLDGPPTPIAPMPDWLVEALTPAPKAPTPPPAPRIAPSNTSSDEQTPAEWYNPPWSQILTGWRLVSGNGEDDGSKWAHPSATAAFSATVRHGCLFVYSPTPGLPVTETNDPNGLTKFRAEALINYGGDMSAAAKDIRDIMPARHTPANTPANPTPADYYDTRLNPAPLIIPDTPTDTPTDDQADDPADTGHDYGLVHWATMWATDHGATQWLIPPFIAAGRNHAIVADAKAGKSLLLLEAALSVATGARWLDAPEQSPRHVVYIDYEMGLGDLEERLRDMGHDNQSDLEHLHYMQMPDIPALDTALGGRALANKILTTWPGVALVVIDTMARAVDGEENDAQTTNALYRHTIMPLKAAGCAVVRLDHIGHQGTHARGSSAKAADIDIEWHLSAAADEITLKATRARMSWVPEYIRLTRGNNTPMHTFKPGPRPESWDCAAWLQRAPRPVNINQAAHAMTGTDLHTSADRKTAERRLKSLVDKGLAIYTPQPAVGTPATYLWDHDTADTLGGNDDT
jgi:hypothetical protein